MSPGQILAIAAVGALVVPIAVIVALYLEGMLS